MWLLVVIFFACLAGAACARPKETLFQGLVRFLVGVFWLAVMAAIVGVIAAGLNSH
jgi:type IV secretory pathway VirB2 component (pilin)